MRTHFNLHTLFDILFSRHLSRDFVCKSVVQKAFRNPKWCNKTMFKHSVKVPRNFKIAANILKKVSTEGGSVKTLLYDSKLRHFNTNVLYALLTKAIQHTAEIDKIFENCSLFKNEPRLDPWLAKVLAAELLYGKKALPGHSKPEQTIFSYKEQFEKFTSVQQDDKTEAPMRPRYVRINTNLLTTSDAIRAFQDEGYRFIRCTSGSYDDYLKQIQGLTEYDFTQDYHVKTLFVFAAGTKFHESDLYLENKIILQDKATAMAVHLLAPPAGSVVMDMCAAPGMKTSQLAAFMRNEGKIYAVERNEQRYETLCDFIEKTGSKCVQTLHQDALELKRGDYDDVEYIVLDPSCTGSGMALSVHNYIDDTRLAKLTSLQEKFLKHAMNAFPNAKRIVYSTCSLFPEENERVITNVVKAARVKWRVQDVKELLKGQWNNIGSGMYGSMGSRCLYSRPDSDLTTGFFLAVLDRDVKDLERRKNARKIENAEMAEDGEEGKEGEESDASSKRKKQSAEESTNALEEDSDARAVKKKKKRRKHVDGSEEENAIDGASDNAVPEDNSEMQMSKKKKKKIDLNENVGTESNIDSSALQETAIECGSPENSTPKKKKKKDKHKTDKKEAENVTEQDHDDKPRKKKKHKEHESENQGVEQESNTLVKNKKKKYTEFENDVADKELTDSPKRKKKLKNPDT